MEIQDVLISKIVVHDNSRKKYKEADMSALMNSINETGLLQPIGLIPFDDGTFELVFGNRRLLAFKKLGIKKIPANILEEGYENEADVLITNLIENEHRSDVPDIDKGRYYDALIKDHTMTESEVAARMSLPKTKIAQCLRLHREIPEEFRKKVGKASKSNASGKKGMVPATTADQIVQYTKRKGHGKQILNQLLDHAKQDKTTNNHLSHMFKLIDAGATVKKAAKAVEDIKMVSISVPVKTEDWDEFVKEFGSSQKVQQMMCLALYGEEDQVVFQRPY